MNECSHEWDFTFRDLRSGATYWKCSKCPSQRTTRSEIDRVLPAAKEMMANTNCSPEEAVDMLGTKLNKRERGALLDTLTRFARG